MWWWAPRLALPLVVRAKSHWALELSMMSTETLQEVTCYWLLNHSALIYNYTIILESYVEFYSNYSIVKNLVCLCSLIAIFNLYLEKNPHFNYMTYYYCQLRVIYRHAKQVINIPNLLLINILNTEILSNNKKIIKCWYMLWTWIGLENMLSEINQTQKTNDSSYIRHIE
jgi:hypothetical protein